MFFSGLKFEKKYNLGEATMFASKSEFNIFFYNFFIAAPPTFLLHCF